MRDTPKALFYSAAIAMAQREPEQREKVYRDMMGFVLTGGLPASSRGGKSSRRSPESFYSGIAKIDKLRTDATAAVFDATGQLKSLKPEKGETGLQLGKVSSALSQLESAIEVTRAEDIISGDAAEFFAASRHYVPTIMTYLFGKMGQEGWGGSGWGDLLQDIPATVLGGRKDLPAQTSVEALADNLELVYTPIKGGGWAAQYFKVKDAVTERDTTGSVSFGELKKGLSNKQLRALELSLAYREYQLAKNAGDTNRMQQYEQIINQLKPQR